MSETVPTGSELLEAVDELERLLGHRHASGGGHLHGFEIEMREAYNAVAQLRENVRQGRLEPSVLERVRSGGQNMHVNEPLRFAELLEMVEQGLRARS